MVGLDVQTTAAAVAVSYREAPRVIARTLPRTLQRIGQQLQTRIVRDKLRGGVLDARTGNLSRAIFYRVELHANEAVVRVGADGGKAVYARIHEFGGVIKPVRAQRLAIPLAPALTAKGVARMSAREFFDSPRSLGFVSAFVNRRGTAILGVTSGRTVRAVFALRTSQSVQAKWYLRGTVAEQADWIRQQFGTDLQQALSQL